jgi:iron complex transport system ATP-binding protein
MPLARGTERKNEGTVGGHGNTAERFLAGNPRSGIDVGGWHESTKKKLTAESVAPVPAAPLVVVDRVGKRFGDRQVLENIGFSVERGECFGIIGPNGSGKSTLLNLISGVENPDSGQIVLAGKPVTGHPRKQLARWLAVLQQEPVAAEGFTVREVVEMGRYPFQNWFGDEAEDPAPLIDGILDKLELTGLSGRRVDELSGGERQRVALGKIMAQEPKLLLLDEPTTYLDIGHQAMLMEQIRSWRRDTGLTVIAVMHDLNLAALFCDRLLLIKDGKQLAVGSPADILSRDMIRGVYGVEPVIFPHPLTGVPQLLLGG